MQNVDHLYRPRGMSTNFNKFQPAIIQEHSQRNSPRGDSYYSDLAQKACAPQPVPVAQCPIFQAPLSIPPPSPFGYNAPVPNASYFPQPVQQFQFQHFPPTPPATPPPAVFDQAQYFDPSQRLQFLHTLGSGAYGVVHLAKDVLTGIQYAVKVLNKFTANGLPLDARQQHFQQTEMQLHYEVSAHPNVVSLLRILDVADCTYVVMEYCPEGDLFLNITERGRYVGNDLAAKAVFLQILDAVAHCHRLGVYHRDLKPENVLVSDGGSQVKLADFGLATTDSYSSDFGCGSTFYMSPECQDQSSGMPYYACAPNDIWSLGVILVNLTCGRNPWKSASPKDSTFRAYMEDRHFLKSILPLSDELNEILGMVFEMDPSRRISLEELRHRIISCPRFTKQASPVPIIEVTDNDFVDEELEVCSTALSPASTISEEGSMISDSSDDSTVPSEADSTSEFDPQFEIMDEDLSSYEDFEPVESSKDWDPTSYVSIDNSYVSVSSADAIAPGTTALAQENQVPAAQPPAKEPTVPVQASAVPRYLSPRSVPRRQPKSVQQLLARCVTPSQLSLLNPFCPQSGGQRGASIRRAF